MGWEYHHQLMEKFGSVKNVYSASYSASKHYKHYQQVELRWMVIYPRLYTYNEDAIRAALQAQDSPICLFKPSAQLIGQVTALEGITIPWHGCVAPASIKRFQVKSEQLPAIHRNPKWTTGEWFLKHLVIRYALTIDSALLCCVKCYGLLFVFVWNWCGWRQ